MSAIAEPRSETPDPVHHDPPNFDEVYAAHHTGLTVRFTVAT